MNGCEKRPRVAERVRASLGRVLLVAFAALAAAAAHAQQFPTRPVRFVVPYPPGGSNDILARMIVPKMSEQLGHNVVVDNRGGANAIIGSEIVAKAVPDGHTILIIGGRVAVSFSTVAVARPHLQSGKITGLGVTTARRSLVLPNMPTIAESGLPGYEVSGWYGLVAPATTPKAAIARLHSVVMSALRQPEIKAKLLGVGVEVVDSTTAQFGSRIDAELARWEKIVKPLRITPE